MKIITVLGARPQFIKAALVSRELRKNHNEIIVHTGQHYNHELSDIFFEEMNIPQPDYNLGIGSDTHARQTGQMMSELEALFIKEKPDIVLVYGDTNSTLAAALAAVKLHIPVAHVEAGPRMNDKAIPEEVNRVVTDHISSMLFAPTPVCLDNLHREGLTQGVYMTGDVMLDCFLHFSQEAEKRTRILDDLGIEQGNYLLATVHRASNTDTKENLQEICKAFIELAHEIELVFPVHPRTEKYLKQYGLYQTLKDTTNIHLIKPVGYLEMLALTKNAVKILTDSGGLQKEAYFAKVPCITLDTVSAWPETVEDGWNIVVGKETDRQQIQKENIINAVRSFEPNKKQQNVFGDGKARHKICRIITQHTAPTRKVDA
ncbi:MAG: non-hydrolyzing UDP-N-acetylglucosamine 2-epimerase [Fastidiosipilaceae bacterium]